MSTIIPTASVAAASTNAPRPPLPAYMRAAAEFIARGRNQRLPEPVLDAAKKCLVDWFGVALGARDEPAGRAVRATVASWRSQGDAAVLFGQHSAAAPAALANGTLAHCLDFDDTHTPSVAHLSGPTWAAVLAVGSAARTTVAADAAVDTPAAAALDPAASQGRRGALTETELLVSFVVGFETGARLGGRQVASAGGELGFGIAADHSGWHSTGVFGALGAAAGAACALGLDAAASASALGAAATQVGGLTGSFGTMSKPFHAGKAAFHGVLSAELAAVGFAAALNLVEPDGALERALVPGAHGSHGSAAGAENAAPALDFEAGWQILGNTFKPYACCLLTHASIDAARRLGKQIEPAAIARATAFVNPLAVKLAGIAAPRAPLEGKFSTAFCVALGLSGYSASQGDFTASRLGDPGLQALTARVTLQGDPALAETAARLQVEGHDGRVFDADVPLALGNPGNPLAWEDLQAKFTALVEPVLGASACAELFVCLRHFERPGSLAKAWHLACVVPPASVSKRAS